MSILFFFLVFTGMQCTKFVPVLIPRFQDVLAKLFLESLHDAFSFLLIQGNKKAFHLEILKDVSDTT